MFDIRIGTLIPADKAVSMIRQLNPKGFESYQLNFYKSVQTLDFNEYARAVREAAEDRPLAFGLYGNTIQDPEVRAAIEKLIRSAPLLDCRVIGLFAGADPKKTVPENIPGFRAVFEPLVRMAEANGVKLALEGCGGGWNGSSGNIAFCADAWELIFDAVPSEALGLEWEPCHALECLADPISQLRRWAPRVTHLHGKDGTVARDVLQQYGFNGGHPFMWDRTPGFGDTNWADVFTILLQAGFAGSCDIEGYHDPVHYDDMEWTAQLTALNYLKNCRGGQEYFRGPEEYRGYQGTRRHGGR